MSEVKWSSQTRILDMNNNMKKWTIRSSWKGMINKYVSVNATYNSQSS